jgi:hypothetical protein
MVLLVVELLVEEDVDELVEEDVDELVEEELVEELLVEELVDEELVEDVDDPGGGGTIGVNPSALARKVAIWARVTGSSGQNRSFVGGLQPFVIPVAPNHSMSDSKIDPSSSVNDTGAPGVSTPTSARCKNAAICPRVTGSSGQKRSPAVLQPSVIPVAPNHSMSDSKIDPSSSVNDTGAPGVSTPTSARCKNAAICPRVTGSSGQKRSPAVLQPSVIASAAIASMSGS